MTFYLAKKVFENKQKIAICHEGHSNYQDDLRSKLITFFISYKEGVRPGSKKRYYRA